MVNKKMIQTINLQRAFTTEEVRTIALNGVNLEINEGEFVAIMGPSGCGKSTLLNILGLLDAPTGGQYLLGGQDVTPLSCRGKCLARWLMSILRMASSTRLRRSAFGIRM